MRDYINQIKANPSPNYCHRVTANDGKLGEQHLRDFQDNAKTIPTILTTSQKLSIGVDARNVRNIVLMRPIRSMIEFKQIIGRGTRVHDGKDYFTIYDFVKAHENFNDPEWDGEPVPPEGEPPQPPGPKPEPPEPPEPPAGGGDEGGDDPKSKLIIKLADGKERKIQYIAATTYWGPDGKPLTAQQFLERLFGDLSGMIATEDELRRLWSNPESREHFTALLEQRGYDADKLSDMRRQIDAPNSDLFDVLAYIRFTTPPKTRADRANAAVDQGAVTQQATMQEFLKGVLQAYVALGETELASQKLSGFLTARYGTLADAKTAIGDLPSIRVAFIELQRALYRQ